MTATIIKVEPIMAVMTPLVLSRSSHHFYRVASEYEDDDAFLPMIYLYCVAVELGLKAAILASDCTPEVKDYIKVKIGHDLIKATKRFEDIYPSIFDQSDYERLEQVNKLYKNKGIEYFTMEALDASLRGWKTVPRPNDLRLTAKKVYEFQLENDSFIDAETSVTPKRGIIGFI